MIYVASVHHTGTWFVLRMLLDYPKVGQLIEAQNLPNYGEVHANDVLHMHITRTEGTRSPDTGEVDHPIMHDAFIAKWGAIIPLRDPLRSMITRHARHPKLDHRFIVNGFRYLADRWYEAELQMVAFVPIDRLHMVDVHDLSIRIRLALYLVYDEVTPLSAYCAALDKELQGYIKRSLTKNKPQNFTGPTSLKRAYDEGDVDTIRATIPREWDYLKEWQEDIQPFLESQGYTDLLWWR